MLVAYRPLSLRNDLRMSGELGAQPDPNLTFEREHPFCLNRSSTPLPRLSTRFQPGPDDGYVPIRDHKSKKA